MKSYDKAAWHIDGGEKESDVIARFEDVFNFLNGKKMLNMEGKETLEYCMDDSVSLNSNMVTAEGEAFLDTYYDIVLKRDPNNMYNNLKEAYKEFVAKK